jgi:hypothetical protein
MSVHCCCIASAYYGKLSQGFGCAVVAVVAAGFVVAQLWASAVGHFQSFAGCYAVLCLVCVLHAASSVPAKNFSIHRRMGTCILLLVVRQVCQSNACKHARL